MERRVAWLERQVAELGLENVEVVRARAEDTKLNGTFDQVTARAVSALRTLIPITAPPPPPPVVSSCSSKVRALTARSVRPRR